MLRKPTQEGTTGSSKMAAFSPHSHSHKEINSANLNELGKNSPVDPSDENTAWLIP